MRIRLVMMAPVLVAILFSSLTASAQQPPAAGTTAGQFNRRDFTGYWMRNTVRPKDSPPLTPAGMEAMKGRLPDDAVEVPTDGNDPMYKCNPQGFPRLVWEENEPIEFVHTPDRIIQLFQWERTLRELWLDGRPLPSGDNLENLGPAWYGHTTGRWEGDTLVMETIGVDPRAWLDEYGHPKSFDARFEERYQRIDANTIEGQLTIYDPKNFTAPWIHPKSLFQRMAAKDVNFFGWKGLFSGLTDAICAPTNELDEFNKRIRDPGVFGVEKK